MSMIKLALHNFKASFKSYLSLIISLAFTTCILTNFINLVTSGILDQLGEYQAKNIEVSIQVLTVVIVCFMVFFIWYATNVFLNRRKKEIGTYVFMGLSNQKIAQLYIIEVSLIGLVAVVLGISLGLITSQLFTMIILKLSDIAFALTFSFSFESMVMTLFIVGCIYSIFSIKGYINIVRSSVLDMVSANRKNEYVPLNSFILMIKAIFGCISLCLGYYLAIKEGGLEVVGNILAATILVIVGIYLVFGGLFPLILQTLAKNKIFIYHKQRVLWVNSLIFRMKKNYRTYAMVCVLMLCSVTALGFGLAMKTRADNINHFENTYTFQVLSDSSGYMDEFSDRIEIDNDIAYKSEIEVIVIPNELSDNDFTYFPYALVSYSQIEQAAINLGLEFNFQPLENDQFIQLEHLYLMSLMNDMVAQVNVINDQKYTSVGKTNQPYLGYMQESMEYMIVNDDVFASLKPLGQSMVFYNYKLVDPANLLASIDDINASDYIQGLVKIDPNSNSNAWVNILYSVSLFVCMVFVFASACILFMKVYNDSFDEQDRYKVLIKLGIDPNVIQKAIAAELKVMYVIPLVLMSISSIFSIQAIAKVMSIASLYQTNLISLVVVTFIFIISYYFSKIVYFKNMNIND